MRQSRLEYVKPDLDGLGALGDLGWHCPERFRSGILLWSISELGRRTNCNHIRLFIGNLKMELTAIGTKGTLRVDDFVIPFQETEASLTTCTKAWFNKPVTAWVNPPSEQTVKTELPQLPGGWRNEGQMCKA
ncbi:hypothetical protein F2Q70_00044946 [Brassica cretica]|uniref:Uncharacterized protein n=1 Tax=Brassica cretica TaxID=69181 RepID=A0A8S9KL51_BRACR|nr:hypothetical protein F2Q70_00044946 [Brassica cretica]